MLFVCGLAVWRDLRVFISVAFGVSAPVTNTKAADPLSGSAAWR
jgi:hypothetical protein